MRRILIPLALLLVLGLGVQAQAGSALSLLDPYQVNLLEDEDYESGIVGTDEVLGVGDYLFGMFAVSDFVRSLTGPLFGTPAGTRSPEDDTFTGVFVVKVTSAVEDEDGEWDFEFAPAEAAVWSTLTGAALTPTMSNTLVMVFDDHDGPAWVNPYLAIPAALMTAANGNELWELGFTAERTDLFWTAHAISNDIADIVEEGDVTFRAAMDVTEYVGGPILLPHNFRFSDVWSDVQMTGRNQFGGGSQGSFALLTDTEMWIVPTPEPGTFALLGLGLAACGAVVVRRRRKA